MEVPERWRGYPCEDYYSSPLATDGYWDEPGQLWSRIPQMNLPGFSLSSRCSDRGSRWVTAQPTHFDPSSTAASASNSTTTRSTLIWEIPVYGWPRLRPEPPTARQ
jgi:hypothetical protein